jgi:hypothetical protein
VTGVLLAAFSQVWSENQKQKAEQKDFWGGGRRLQFCQKKSYVWRVEYEKPMRT